MSFRPWLGTEPKIDQALQIGLGAAASVVGQTYTVYRLGSQSGSVISGTPLFTDFPAVLGPRSQKIFVENTTFDLIVYYGTLDNRLIEKMDVFLETGYENDQGIWICAQIRPLYPTLFVRAETLCFLTRPYTEAGSVAEQPSGSVLVQTGYGGTRIGIEKYLTLTSGIYSFSESATVGASIPMQIQPLNRIRDGSKPKVPTAQYRTHHLIYMPTIGGEMPDVQDRVNAANGDRYELMEVHSTAPTGLDGWVCIAEKLPT